MSMGRAMIIKVNVVCMLVLVALAIAEGTPPGIANNPSHARCLIKKYKMCYNLEHVCPKFCPDSCTVECVSCKPICGDGSTSPPPDTEVPSPPEETNPPDHDDSGGEGKSPPPSDGDKDDHDGKKSPSPPKEANPPEHDGSGGEGKSPPPSDGDKDDHDGKKSPPPSDGDKDDHDGKKSPPPSDGDKDDHDGKKSPPPTLPPSPSPPKEANPPDHDGSGGEGKSPPSPPSPTPPTPSQSPSPSSPTPPTPPSQSPTPPSTTPPTPLPSIPGAPPPEAGGHPKPQIPPPPPYLIPVTPSGPSPTIQTPPPPSTTLPPPPSPGDSSEAAAGRRMRCKNRNYPQCYGLQHLCPSSCLNTCVVDCVTCKPVCNCDMPGAVCQDPRFIGGDGITFYFHGKKDKDFCLVTEPNFQINAHFIGKTNENIHRDFTWVQSIAILFGDHQLFIGAQKTAAWNDAVDRLSLAFNSDPILLSAAEGSTWQSAATSIKRDSDTNSVIIHVEGQFQISAKVVPITQQESQVHNYGITEEDCFAHLELAFKFFSLSGKVNGVLGQTYGEKYVSRAKMGVAMPVLGGEREFAVSNIFATDCAVSQFAGGKFSPENDRLSVLQLPSMKCGTGIGGKGVVCKR